MGGSLRLGFTFALLVHEMGHYIAVKRRGLEADLPFFMPGMGAYVRWYGAGVSREDLAAISLAGPMFGLMIALVYLAVWVLFHAAAGVCGAGVLYGVGELHQPVSAVDVRRGEGDVCAEPDAARAGGGDVHRVLWVDGAGRRC